MAGSLTINSGANWVEKLASSGSYDSLMLKTVGTFNLPTTGSVTLNLVSVNGFEPQLSDVYDLVTFPYGETVNFAANTNLYASGLFTLNMPGPYTQGVGGADIMYVPGTSSSSPGEIELTNVAPEPGSATVAMIIAAGSLLRRRRRPSSAPQG
jgi:MYXO-CTERM domain-containing protein